MEPQGTGWLALVVALSLVGAGYYKGAFLNKNGCHTERSILLTILT